jgi:hypothetical protein
MIKINKSTSKEKKEEEAGIDTKQNLCKGGEETYIQNQIKLDSPIRLYTK